MPEVKSPARRPAGKIDNFVTSGAGAAAAMWIANLVLEAWPELAAGNRELAVTAIVWIVAGAAGIAGTAVRNLPGVAKVLGLAPALLLSLVVTGACAVGSAGPEGARGIVIGQGRIVSCEPGERTDPAEEAPETERCVTIAGAAISEQGAGILDALTAPLRWLVPGGGD